MLFVLLKEAWANLRRQKLKNSIAALGIFWGAYAVTLLVSLGQGIYAYNMQSVAPFTKTVLRVSLYQTKTPYLGFGPGQKPFLTNEAIMSLPETLTGIATITPLSMQWENTFTTANKKITGPLQGVASDYYRFYTNPYEGRTLKKEDIDQHRQVAFLSKYTKERLFPNQNPIGQSMSINNLYFKIIGYATDNPSFSFGSSGIDVPYSVFTQFYPDQVQRFLLELKANTDVTIFKKQLTTALATRLHFSPQDPNAVQIDNITQYAKQLILIMILVKYFLFFCGLMSLMVGGIGIANMMYLLVKERTHEIGLKMALGAQPNWILGGILLEAAILVLGAAFFALLCAFCSLILLHQVHLPQWLGVPRIIPFDFGLIFAFLLATALISGYFPARHAAKIMPVAALNDRSS